MLLLMPAPDVYRCMMAENVSRPRQKHPFSLWLVEARKRRGWSQSQTAEAADLDQGYISKLENYRDDYSGTISERGTVRRLARALASDGAGGDSAQLLMDRGLLAAGYAADCGEGHCDPAGDHHARDRI